MSFSRKISKTSSPDSHAPLSDESLSDESLSDDDWELIDQEVVVTKSYMETETDQNSAARSDSIQLRVDCIFIPIIGQINMTENTFHMRCDLDLSWPATYDEEKTYAADEKAFEPCFAPNVIIQNAMDVQNELTPGANGNPYSIDQGRVKVRIKSAGVFLQKFDVASFPFDTQDLTIVFSLSFTDATKVNYRIPESGIFFYVPTQNMALAEFEIVSLHAGVAVEGNFSHLYASVMVRREWKAYVADIVIYAVLLNLTCLTAFFCKDVDNQINVVITLMLSLMALLFVSAELVPRSFEVSLLDRYLLSSFLYMLLVLIMLIHDSERQDEFEFRHGFSISAIMAIAHIFYFVVAAVFTWHAGKNKMVNPMKRFLQHRQTLPTLQCAKVSV